MEQLFIIKLGGNVIDDPCSLNIFLKDIASVKGKKIIVHGGGKIATNIGMNLGITAKYVEGRRITDADTIDLVTMVYGGLINKKIVAKLQSLGCNAIGLTGADANIIPAVKRPVKDIDYGFTGDIKQENISTATLQLLCDNGLVPVLASLTHDNKGQILNTNADTIASAVSVALSDKYSVRLIYCFEKKGLLDDITDNDSVIPVVTKELYSIMRADKKLSEGILPKIENSFAAIDAGVKEVIIGHFSDIIQNCTGPYKGTLIK